MNRKTTPMGVVVPTVSNYAIYSQLSPDCQQDLLEVVVISGIKGQLMNSFELFGTSFDEDEIGQQNSRRRTFIDDINAIACGVEAWFEENTGHSENVAGMTIEIARKLGVPEGEIKKWAARRSSFNVERVRPIRSLLQRLYSSPAGGLRMRDIKDGGNPG